MQRTRHTQLQRLLQAAQQAVQGQLFILVQPKCLLNRSSK